MPALATVIFLQAQLSLAAEQALQQVDVYNWPDYIAPEVLDKFTQETGIKVNYSTFHENEDLEARLIGGQSGLDVVFPSASPFFARQIKAGLFRKLDFAKIPNAQGLDKEVMAALDSSDPGNRFGVPYMMYASGFGYNPSMIERAMPKAPVDSWAMLFDPKILANFKGCGAILPDTPTEVLPAYLIYKGLYPGKQAVDAMQDAMKALGALRKQYRYVGGTGKYIDDLAGGRICLAHGYVGDLIQAREKGRKSTPPQDIVIVIPKEGALFGIDMMAIPADARHPDAAHAFINFILRPDIIAQISNETGYANAVPASRSLLDPTIVNDPAIYVPEERKAKLSPPPATGSREYERALAREWAKFRVGKK